MAKSSGDIEFLIAANDEASKVFEQFQSNMAAGVAQVVQSFGSLTEGVSAELDAFGESLDAVFALAMNPTPMGLLQAALSGAGIAFKYLTSSSEESEEALKTQAKLADAATESYRNARQELEELRMGQDRVLQLQDKYKDSLKVVDPLPDRSQQGFWADLLQSFVDENPFGLTGGPKQEIPDRSRDTEGIITAIVNQEELRHGILMQNQLAEERITEQMKEQERIATERNALVNQQMAAQEAKATGLIEGAMTPLERYHDTLKKIEEFNQLDLLGGDPIAMAEKLRNKALKDYNDATKSPEKKNGAELATTNQYESRFVTRGGASSFDAGKVALDQLNTLNEIKQTHIRTLQELTTIRTLHERYRAMDHQRIAAPPL